MVIMQAVENLTKKNGVFSDLYRFVSSQVAIVYPLLYRKHKYGENIPLEKIKGVYYDALVASKVLQAA